MLNIDVKKNDALAALPSKLKEWRRMFQTDLLRDVAEITVRQAKSRFDTQSTPDAKPWPPRKGDYEHPPLIKTGALLRSIRKRRVGANQYLSGVLATGKLKKIAIWQQYGTRSPLSRSARGRLARTMKRGQTARGSKQAIDPRHFIGLGNVDINEIRELIDAFIGIRFR